MEKTLNNAFDAKDFKPESFDAGRYAKAFGDELARTELFRKSAASETPLWTEEPLSEPEARACIRWLADELAAEACALLVGAPEAASPEAFSEPCLEEEPDALVIISVARVTLQEARHD